MMTELEAQKIYTELSQLREEMGRLTHRVEQLGQARATVRTNHPHIVRIDGVRGGEPIVLGTGISVRTIVERVVGLDLTPEQLVDEYEGALTLAQVYDALSYYYEHRQEIDQYIAENREALWRGPRTTRSS